MSARGWVHLLFGAAAVASGIAWVVHHFIGRQLITRLLGASNRLDSYAGETRWTLEQTLVRLPDLMFMKLVVLVWGIAVLALMMIVLAPRLRSRAINALVAVSSLAVVFYGVESFVAPFLIKAAGLENFYVTLNPDHRLPPNVPAIPTNADGIRSRRQSSAFGAAGTNIIFLGDSFTFGKKVPLEQAFPAKVERLLGLEFPADSVRVANFGWVSSCPLLSLRLLEDIGGSYNPVMIVMCVDMTDLHDDLYYGMLIDKRGVYWLFDKAPLTLKLLWNYWPDAFWKIYWTMNRDMPPIRYFASEMPLEETRKWLEPIRANLGRLDAAAKSLGAEFMVVVLPRSYQYSDRECPQNWERDQYTVLGPHSLEPFRFFAELSSEVDYPVYSLLRDFRTTELFPTCFEDDAHWNDTGHTLAALGIARILAHHLRQ